MTDIFFLMVIVWLIWTPYDEKIELVSDIREAWDAGSCNPGQKQ
jgi:hypothetical protein